MKTRAALLGLAAYAQLFVGSAQSPTFRYCAADRRRPVKRGIATRNRTSLACLGVLAGMLLSPPVEAASYNLSFTGTGCGSTGGTGVISGPGDGSSLTSFSATLCGLSFATNDLTSSDFVNNPLFIQLSAFKPGDPPSNGNPQLNYSLSIFFDSFFDPNGPLIGDWYIVEYVIDFAVAADSGDVTFSPVAPVPVPAALPLLATGLGALGVLGWRRKRKLAQA